jgi:hypothetical protein
MYYANLPGQVFASLKVGLALPFVLGILFVVLGFPPYILTVLLEP